MIIPVVYLVWHKSMLYMIIFGAGGSGIAACDLWQLAWLGMH